MPGFGLVIVDESHHWAAPYISQSMFGLCARYRLALTATPERADKLERVVNWFLGPIALHIKRESHAATSVRCVNYSSEMFRSPPPLNRRGDIDFVKIVSALVDDDARTGVIVDQARALASEGHDVLVLSHRREHCIAIARRLVELGIDAATYLGGDKTTPDTTVMVATFSLTSEGFDCPRLTGLVLATPSSNVEQACGRVMRGGGGAVIVDVVDQWGVCYAQAAKRRALYRRSGFTMTKLGPEALTHELEAVPTTFAFID